MKYDVHIAGAGIGGGIAARELARAGLSTIVTEEDRMAGMPQHCTGLVSMRGLRETGVDYEKAVLGRIHGSRIIGPHGETLRVFKGEAQACVIDRPLLDSMCVEAAQEAGAEIRFGKKVAGTDDLLAPVVVGADGAGSTVARIMGFPKFGCCVRGYQQIIQCRPDEDDIVSVVLSQKAFPGFFGWIVPLEDKMIAGFAASAAASIGGRMRVLLKMAGVKCRNAKIEKSMGGIIPFGPRKRTCTNSIVLIGDAGGYSKPTTGGGVYFTALSAKAAAKCIAEGSPGRFDEDMKGIRRELQLHGSIRAAYNLSNDYVIGAFMNAGKMLGIERVLEGKGDMDYASSLLK